MPTHRSLHCQEFLFHEGGCRLSDTCFCCFLFFIKITPHIKVHFTHLPIAGRNEYGQLGHGDKERRDTPTLIETLEDLNIVDAACGRNHTLLISGEIAFLTREPLSSISLAIDCDLIQKFCCTQWKRDSLFVSESICPR